MSEPAQALTNPRIDPWSRWMTMIRQRRVGSAPAVQASATQLPFRDAAFEAALAILTVHHWPDPAGGLGELARVARGRIVILTCDPATSGFWLVDDYFPEIVEIDRPNFPSIEEFSRAFGRVDIYTLPIRHDCVDGFLGAYWRRPHAYLGGSVRSAISTVFSFPAGDARRADRMAPVCLIVDALPLETGSATEG